MTEETTTTAARAEALADLYDRWHQPPQEMIAQLPKPLKRGAEKGRCNECGGWHGLPAVHLDYMGHAEVTAALCISDPEWSWRPAKEDPDAGGPVIITESNRMVCWIWLTVHGKTLPGVGTCDKDKGDPEKELIGDAIRNAAMRFGIGTALWSKADGLDAQSAAPADHSEGAVAAVLGKNLLMAVVHGDVDMARQVWADQIGNDATWVDPETLGEALAAGARAMLTSADAPAEPEPEPEPPKKTRASRAAKAKADVDAAVEAAREGDQ